MRKSVNIPEELVQKAQLKAANEQRLFNFSALVCRLLEDYVSTEEAIKRTK